MLEKLKQIQSRFLEVEKKLSSADAMSDMKLFVRNNKEYKDLKPISDAYHSYKNLLSNISDAKTIISSSDDSDLIDLAKMELSEWNMEKDLQEEKIKILLIPKDPEDSKNAVVEIRAGTGGDEASIFAGDLYKMYTSYSTMKKWKIELVDVAEGTSGGFKEVIFNVQGNDVYGQLKFESGVHRVQRVPETETQGRVHTSANTTYSAVRLTHIPTGVVAQCQDQKSQIKNYEKALKVLRSRIYEMELQKKMEEESSQRKTMVSSGDRSEKIRTYNYPQGRVTDHRIGLTKYNLQSVVSGDLQEFVDELIIAENTQKLKIGKLTDE